jgi:hypothetical protein
MARPPRVVTSFTWLIIIASSPGAVMKMTG